MARNNDYRFTSSEQAQASSSHGFWDTFDQETIPESFERYQKPSNEDYFRGKEKKKNSKKPKPVQVPVSFLISNRPAATPRTPSPPTSSVWNMKSGSQLFKEQQEEERINKQNRSRRRARLEQGTMVDIVDDLDEEEMLRLAIEKSLKSVEEEKQKQMDEEAEWLALQLEKIQRQEKNVLKQHIPKHNKYDEESATDSDDFTPISTKLKTTTKRMSKINKDTTEKEHIKSKKSCLKPIEKDKESPKPQREPKSKVKPTLLESNINEESERNNKKKNEQNKKIELIQTMGKKTDVKIGTNKSNNKANKTEFNSIENKSKKKMDKENISHSNEAIKELNGVKNNNSNWRSIHDTNKNIIDQKTSSVLTSSHGGVTSSYKTKEEPDYDNATNYNRNQWKSKINEHIDRTESNLNNETVTANKTNNSRGNWRVKISEQHEKRKEDSVNKEENETRGEWKTNIPCLKNETNKDIIENKKDVDKTSNMNRKVSFSKYINENNIESEGDSEYEMAEDNNSQTIENREIESIDRFSQFNRKEYFNNVKKTKSIMKDSKDCTPSIDNAVNKDAADNSLGIKSRSRLKDTLARLGGDVKLEQDEKILKYYHDQQLGKSTNNNVLLLDDNLQFIKDKWICNENKGNSTADTLLNQMGTLDLSDLDTNTFRSDPLLRSNNLSHSSSLEPLPTSSSAATFPFSTPTTSSIFSSNQTNQPLLSPTAFSDMFATISDSQNIAAIGPSLQEEHPYVAPIGSEAFVHRNVTPLGIPLQEEHSNVRPLSSQTISPSEDILSTQLNPTTNPEPVESNETSIDNNEEWKQVLKKAERDPAYLDRLVKSLSETLEENFKNGQESDSRDVILQMCMQVEQLYRKCTEKRILEQQARDYLLQANAAQLLNPVHVNTQTQFPPPPQLGPPPLHYAPQFLPYSTSFPNPTIINNEQTIRTPLYSRGDPQFSMQNFYNSMPLQSNLLPPHDTSSEIQNHLMSQYGSQFQYFNQLQSQNQSTLPSVAQFFNNSASFHPFSHQPPNLSRSSGVPSMSGNQFCPPSSFPTQQSNHPPLNVTPNYDNLARPMSNPQNSTNRPFSANSAERE